MQTIAILEAMEQGILICNRHGRIQYMNEAYGSFIGHTLEEVKGKPIADYRKQAKVPEVLETGIPVEGMIRREGYQEYFASIYPILEDGEIRGTISVVTTLEEHHLKKSLKHTTLEERVRNFERQEIQATVRYYGGGVEGKKLAAKELGISLATLYNKLKEN
ncbi:MAG: PAS domain-containing protein [Eubacteriales bacterium]|nr:PAS domain-containing protein [Eubacteriales bacterium]